MKTVKTEALIWA